MTGSTAERKGRDSLRRFLLDLDAKEILELFMELDAHPSNEEGLAPSTYDHYTSVPNCHLLGKPRQQPGNRRALARADYAVAIATTPAAYFNEPQTPRGWREQMREPGVPRSTRIRAWGVLSCALSWAASSSAVPEIHANGCKLAKEPVISRRRSAQRGGTGYAPATRPCPIEAPASTHSPPSSPTMEAPTATRFARGLKATGDVQTGRKDSGHLDWSAGHSNATGPCDEASPKPMLGST